MLMSLKSLSRDKRGATALEYGLIAALVALVLITGATTFGNNLSALFDKLATKVSTQTTAIK
jgi:pilus assembly protein Flp/PilA